jgi:3-oxoacyl-[acyl-carrier protein] reductase
VASIGALVALPMMTVYCASKAAVLGLTRAVAAELAPAIRCNAVCPGGIDTPMARGLLASVPEDHRDDLLAKLTGRQLIKRFAQPEEIAQTLVFLVSDESAFLTGSVLAADGGHSAA